MGMVGLPQEADSKPDAELKEQLQAMEAKVRKMRETRNNLREQGRAIAKKRDGIQSEYKEHRGKLDDMKAELDAIHAERNLYRAKRDAIQSQLRELITQAKGRRNEKGEKKSATAEYSQLLNEINALEERFQTTSSSTKKEKETMERIKRMKRRVGELEPEVEKFEMVAVDLSNLDEAIQTLKSEADEAHKLFVDAIQRADEMWDAYKEGLDRRNFLKAEGDRYHSESLEMHEKANEMHAKIEELMVDVNKAKEELNLAIQERKSWVSAHNNAVREEMKTGAESDKVADFLVNTLLNEGELLVGGLGKGDAAGAKSVAKGASAKKKNMRRLEPIRKR